MYQDAYNSIMHFFQSGLITQFRISKDGKIHILENGRVSWTTFDSMPKLLQWFEDNEL